MARMSVANPPPRPLVLFDGDCRFCRRWIERWRLRTGDSVEYVPFQEVAERFPEIAREDLKRALHFIERDGTVYRGAEAVFRSRASSGQGTWALQAYERIPGAAPVAEGAYQLIARNRMLASVGTKWFWGHDVRPPTYRTSRDLFLRSLGGIYLVAFLSLWLQVDGLIGENGILPISQHLRFARERLGSEAVFLLPTLCWFDSSNAFLHFLCGAGAVISIALIARLAPVFSLVLLFVLYLSLTIAGQTFLSFQWDILLVETGFLAIFVAPWRWRISGRDHAPVPRIGLFLLKLLLFKLMLMSGVVKLTSGDESWWNLSALEYHYWTQPLPTSLGWFADQHPQWTKKLSVAFCLFVEIIVPFFIWAPRRLRHIAASLLIFLQLGIAATGNYSFFNLLTIALCLLLFDETVWREMVKPETACGSAASRPHAKFVPHELPALAVLLVTLPINATLIFSAFKPRAQWPAPVTALHGYLEPLRIVNGYGLFRVMTKSRPEIVIEGSGDGAEWKAYEFYWKPGEVNRAPPWVAPHQPRLDWQMWFAALGTYRHNPWFLSLLERLLHNTPEVTRLLARNPFPADPPRFVRARLYSYRFTTLAEPEATGAWWKREEAGDYLPAVSLENFRSR
ncbi:MAG TPA: lipase maturation factor family protein [Chthoniobacterales bacterium]|nr:lipase maturation factor family protein [Chthoniobacterales bacterium]